MPTSLMTPPEALTINTSAAFDSNINPDDVVEVGLLLPRAWANALIELSKNQRQSVGQILRSMIRQGLVDSDASI